MQLIREIIANFVYPEGRDRRNNAERLANTDDLTGLANSRALAAALPEAEADPDICIIFGDGNDFGLVNKLAGDAAGDHIIKEMGRAFTRHGARVFRKGGDEFVALVPKYRGESTRRTIEEGFGEVVHLELRFTISCGLGDTLAEADIDMRRRKAEQRSTWNNQILAKSLSFQKLRKS